MRWLRCAVLGKGCPLPPPPAPAPEREHEPAIHAARNARQAIRGNAEQAERLAAREATVAAAVAKAAREGRYDPVRIVARDGEGA